MRACIFPSVAWAHLPNTRACVCIFSQIVFSAFARACVGALPSIAQHCPEGTCFLFFLIPCFSSDCPEQKSSEVVDDSCFWVVCPRLFFQLLPVWIPNWGSGAAKAEKTMLGKYPKNKAGPEAENTRNQASQMHTSFLWVWVHCVVLHLCDSVHECIVYIYIVYMYIYIQSGTQ